MCTLQVKGHGDFLLYANASPKSVTVDGSNGEHTFDANTGGLTVTLPQSSKLEHDIHVQF